MMFVVLLVPFGLLAVLLGMDRLERWTVREPRRQPTLRRGSRRGQRRGRRTTVTKKSSIWRTTSMNRSKSTGFVT